MMRPGILTTVWSSRWVSSTGVKTVVRCSLSTPRTGPSRPGQRRLVTMRSPGSDPLDVMRSECLAKHLCDVNGCRLPGTHWVFSVAIAPSDPTQPPNLRTVGIERVSPAGIDFVLKNGSPTSDSLVTGRPLAVMYSQGKYVPGESAGQWRAEGQCQSLPLAEILEWVPHYTITSMVGSKRLAAERREANVSPRYTGQNVVSNDRLAMLSKSHFTEILQKTRIELENGDITMEELQSCIQAFRFVPDRMECLMGGPDSVMWERWEWIRNRQPSLEDNVAESTALAWNEAQRLVPH